VNVNKTNNIVVNLLVIIFNGQKFLKLMSCLKKQLLSHSILTKT